MNKWLQQHSVTVLRFALGIIFVWFGLLKLLDLSPIMSVVEAAYPLLPEPRLRLVLGMVEVIIGLGFITKIALRPIMILFWLQMAGTLAALVLTPSLFFVHGNPLVLTLEGEFVIKNLVLIAAGLVMYAE